MNAIYPLDEVEPAYRLREQILRSVICSVYGAALGGWAWLAYRQCRHRSTPLRQPGHAFLLLCSSMAVLDLGLSILGWEAVQLKLTSRYQSDQFRFVAGYLLGMIICVFVLRSAALDALWRMAIGCLIARCVVFVVIALANLCPPETIDRAFGPSWPSIAETLRVSRELTGPLMTFTTLAAVAADFRHWRTRDWLHNVGVFLALIIGATVSFSELHEGSLWNLLRRGFQSILN